MEGISYNRNDAGRITEDIATAIFNIGVEMGHQYTDVRTTFEANWVGPDEYAFIAKYLGALQDVFANVDSVGKVMSEFVIEAATAMSDFQNSISTELGGNTISNQIENKYDIIRTSDSYYIKDLVATPTPTFDGSVQLGLVTANSENVLVSTLENCTQKIQAKIKQSISDIDVRNAFVSSENSSMGIQTFINNVGDSMQNLTKMVDSFKNETIPALVELYKKQSSSIANDSTSAASAVDSQINA